VLAFTLLVSTLAFAAPDEAVVQEMAQRSSLSPPIIRRDYDACDSGELGMVRIRCRLVMVAATSQLCRYRRGAQVRADSNWSVRAPQID